ncbi:MAG: D-aminoacylase [Alphaproteobacteria bacterium]|nr:D-aminoacylase [Alphaproteobacteria bacterium]
MASKVDLVIRGGNVVDGTGAQPMAADVAIAGGRIAAIGKIAASGAEEIDAKGLLVTPGFVDIHTHYDGQAIWDTHMAPSAWHGVTTAVMGNCGVGFAPCKPEDREKLVELMEGVEDIPGAVMHEGLQWEWESFSEYLDALERRQRDIDVCALLPHAAVRVYVMGERAIKLEPANQGDIAVMRRITAEAVAAGAFGVSTSRTTSHKSLTGEYTPTLRALEAELTGLAQGLGDAGAGFLEVVSEWTQPDPESEFAMLRRVVEASGRNAVFTLAQRNNGPESWPDLLRYADDAIRAGTSIRPVIAPRAIGLLLGLEGSQNPFSGTRSYCTIAKLSIADRVQRMRDPEFRRQLLADDPKEFSTFPLFHRMSYDQMFRFGHPPNYTPKREDAISAIAGREGHTPQEVAYDIMLENEGHGFIYAPIVNYGRFDLSISETQLADRNTIMGLGDGGAHVGFILDAGFQTWLLNYWGKERRRFDIGELVRRLTSDPAGAAGLGDRGVLAVGKKADVNLIDYDRIGYDAPHVAYDLPAGGRRLLQRAHGYVATIVSGQVTYRNGEATGALPGRLVRGQPTP